MSQELQDMARQLGEVQGRLKGAEVAIREQHKDIKDILRTLNQAKGGWKTLLLIAGVAGVLGALAAKAFGVLGMGVK